MPRPTARRLLFAPLVALSLSIGCLPGLPGLAGSHDGVASGAHLSTVVEGNGDTGTAPANGRTLLAIYMMGSDLEDDVSPRNKKSDETDAGGALVRTGAGSDDLREILAGYNQLSATEKANTDILVAMGGARKQGWKGIKYLNLAMLVNDAKDDYFGNDGPFLDEDPTADTADKATFQAFLTKVQARADGAGKVYVDLWDHGGAYLGLGPDKNSGRKLSLKSMEQALDATKFQADVVGFDACLMASLEVATAFSGHFKYMVASEETEPGHGWDYTPIVAMMGKQPMATSVAMARNVVDTFITSPKHLKTNGRTLSVISLEKLAGVKTSLDALSAKLNADLPAAFQPLATAVHKSPKYGSHGAHGDEYSVDLQAFADSLKGDFGSVGGALRDAVKAAVVYARDSGDKPQSHGMTLFSLDNTTYFGWSLYGPGNSATTNWLGLVSGFMARAAGDLQKPAFQAESISTQAVTGGPGGVRVKVTDNAGLRDVGVIHAVRTEPGGHRYMEIAVEEPGVAETQPNTYVMPPWDGKAIHLMDGGRVDVLVPVVHEGLNEEGAILYMAKVRWNDQDAVLFLEWDTKTNEAVDQWVVPFDEDAVSHDEVAEKEQFSLAEGDTIAFNLTTTDSDTDAETHSWGPAVKLTHAPVWKYGPVSGEKFYFLKAFDLHGNAKDGPLHKVE
ncbi:MAG: hypothetical protein H7338_04920 [Candidatus Sericytochromatia bacterium]|nr:hypothetical protein [Candidatus Sericytochromatia bacterium]